MKGAYQNILFSILCIIIVYYIPIRCAASNQDQVVLFIPKFEGSGYLGQNVATVLNLQIWQTLRKSPSPNPDNLKFGKGLILWHSEQLSIENHKIAESIIEQDDILAQFILWGKSWKYGNGIVVQSYLSIPKYEDYRENHPEIWSISFNNINKKKIVVKIDIPSRRYEFKPIILRPEIVGRFSVPSNLKIYKYRSKSEIIGNLGSHYTAIEHKDDFVFVESDDIKGWIYLPKLSKERSEIVEFIGGLIRVFRGDWQGAIDLFKKVIEMNAISSSLKIDTYLYLALLKEKLGYSGKNEVDKAYKLNPYNKTTTYYSLMTYISELKSILGRYGDRKRKIKLIEKIEKYLDRNGFLFPKNDPFILSIKKLIDHIKD